MESESEGECLKIAFDHQTFILQRYGGISRYFVELAKNLSEISPNAPEIKIIAPFYKNKYLYESRNKLNFRGLLVPDIPKTGRLLRYANNFISPIVLKHMNPDISHETYYFSNINKASRARRVITVYDMIHEIFPDQFSNNDPTRDAKKRAIARADHIVCISENTREDLVNILDVERDRTSVVHLGFALDSREPKAVVLENKPFLLYVGSRHGYKNFSRVIEAYASSAILSKEFDFVCFGGGDIRPKEINLFRRLKLPLKQIHYVSGDDDLLAGYYKNASLFIYPSLYEGFGIPPLEAMSYGCPVACSNTSSIPEVVGEAAILFDPYSIDSIRHAMEEILIDSSLRSSVLLKGYDRIHHFSWTKCATETLNIYEGLLG
jgi:glycosyltransferase involved in cell wall biosynthesis